MVTRVPAVERAATILEFLGRDPGQGYSASEISTAVGIHKATGHAILVSIGRPAYADRGRLA